MSIAIRSALPTGIWSVDPAHSSVGFSATHLGIATVRGTFNEFEGGLAIAEDGTMRARGTVRADSIDTNEEKRDAHLCSDEILSAGLYPELTFESTEIRALGEAAFEIQGELTMRGVTRGVALRAELRGTDSDPWGNERVALEVTGQLRRRDWDMCFRQAAVNAIVSDRVKLQLDISAIRQVAAVAA